MPTETPRRPGSETRADILRVALRLFTERGYEGASIRDISQELGITKSSLYYHFAGKEAIMSSLIAERRSEFDELLSWVDRQEPGPDLLQRAALHWIESTTEQRLLGLRFAHANRPFMSRLATGDGGPRSWFDIVVDRVLPADATAADRITARMAFDSVSTALFAADGSEATDDEVLAAARSATIALTSAT